MRRHRARNLVEADRAMEEGIPVTAVPRTLLDMAAETDDKTFKRIVERAEKRGRLDARRRERRLSGAGDTAVTGGCGGG